MTDRPKKTAYVLSERERLIRRLLKQRRLLGERWNVHAHPKPSVSVGGIYLPSREEMHTVLKSTPTYREIASLDYREGVGYVLLLWTVGPAGARGYPGVLPRMAQRLEISLSGFDVETAFEEVYRTALKMWKAGAKARADHNDFKKP